MTFVNAYTEQTELAPGYYRNEHYVKQIAYSNNGVLTRIANQLGNSGDPAMSIGVNELVDFRIRSQLAGQSPVLRFGHGGTFLTATPIGTNNTDGIVSGNSIMFPGAWANADLEFIVGGHVVQKNIYLSTGHPTSFVLRLDDHIGLDPDTLATDDFRILQPILTNPTDGETIQLVWQVSTQGQRIFLQVDLPNGDYSGWVLDPTFTVQPDATAGLDTPLRQSNPTTNFGTFQQLTLRQTASGLGSNFVIKFDVSSIPASATINSATMYLYKDSTNMFSQNYTHRVYDILSANSGWLEAQATWNVQSTGVAWAGGSNGCAVSGTDHNATHTGEFTILAADVEGTEYAVTLNTTSIDAWLAGNNYGVVTKWFSGGLSLVYYGPRSSDYATDTTKRPKLTIDYTAGGSVLSSRIFNSPIFGAILQ